LEGVLRLRAATVTGILNGVDYDEWSPANDQFIAAKYSPSDLSGKAKDKQDLLKTFGIANADAKLPVIGIVSRFAAQKGFDLIAQIMDRLAREDMILVVLGDGRQGIRGDVSPSAEAVPAKDCSESGLRQYDRTQDRSRCGYVLDAIKVRACASEHIRTASILCAIVLS